MSRKSILLFLVGAVFARAALADGGVKISVTHLPEACDSKAENGKYVGVHYVGMLTDGTEFDNSYNRGEPIEFQLGAQQVIAGWEEGIQGMCVGEKRRLEIPPHLGYGEEGIGPIPGGATLVFDVELARITDEAQDSQGGDSYGGAYDVYQGFGGEGYGEDEDLGEINFADMKGSGGDEDEPEWS